MDDYDIGFPMPAEPTRLAPLITMTNDALSWAMNPDANEDVVVRALWRELDAQRAEVARLRALLTATGATRETEQG